jgi:hypothetical protein
VSESPALRSFFGSLGHRLRVLKEIRAPLDRYLAPRFSVFDYIEPDEVGLSRIIADLLQPAGKHGQGDRFLRAFLDLICKTKKVTGHSCTVALEDPTLHIGRDRRRIDVSLDFEGMFGIAIENKPWADELPDQLSDYVDHMRRKYRAAFIMVFLSPQGDDPKSLKANDISQLKRKGQLQCISFTGPFMQWLDSCARECEAESVRHFVRDFAAYVKRNFPLYET